MRGILAVVSRHLDELGALHNTGYMRGHRHEGTVVGFVSIEQSILGHVFAPILCNSKRPAHKVSFCQHDIKRI